MDPPLQEGYARNTKTENKTRIEELGERKPPQAAFNLFSLRSASLHTLGLLLNPRREAFTIANTAMVEFFQKVIIWPMFYHNWLSATETIRYFLFVIKQICNMSGFGKFELPLFQNLRVGLQYFHDPCILMR